jgi:prephenate dehydrogenase
MVLSRAESAAQLPARICFLGLGLIGGSVALALREAGYAGTMVAWTPEGRGPREAARRGIVDAAAESPAEAIRGAGIVILAGPPLAIVDMLRDLGGPLRGALADGTTLTDVGSTKRAIIERAAASQLAFVGGHPMAGRETTGIQSATADLFVGRPWIVVPGPDARGLDTDTVWSLALATGADPTLMAADLHDRAAAAISHLPLVLAAALVETVAASDPESRTWRTGRQIAASGWRDMSRLAKGDPQMGAGILATNAEPVRDQLLAIRSALDQWIEALGSPSPDHDAMAARLERARAALVDA